MRFLLVNDDGYRAAGLEAMRRAASRLGECVVVAPRERCSAKGHGVTEEGVIRVERAEDGFVVGGLPADCVRLGLMVLRKEVGPVDWVLAGINRGGNVGVDVYYSGTVGAAREAVIQGVPGIAISQYVRDGVEPDWQRAERWAASLVEQLIGQAGGRTELWSVNLPALGEAERLAGVAVCGLSTDPGAVRYRQAVGGGPGGPGVEYAGVYSQRPVAPGTDVDRLFAGWITVTRLGLDLTAEAGGVALISPE